MPDVEWDRFCHLKMLKSDFELSTIQFGMANCLSLDIWRVVGVKLWTVLRDNYSKSLSDCRHLHQKFARNFSYFLEKLESSKFLTKVGFFLIGFNPDFGHLSKKCWSYYDFGGFPSMNALSLGRATFFIAISSHSGSTSNWRMSGWISTTWHFTFTDKISSSETFSSS